MVPLLSSSYSFTSGQINPKLYSALYLTNLIIILIILKILFSYHGTHYTNKETATNRFSKVIQPLSSRGLNIDLKSQYVKPKLWHITLKFGSYREKEYLDFYVFS